MKTVEELQEMSHEDLVNYVQIVQNELKSSKDVFAYTLKEKEKAIKKYDSLKDALKSLSVLIE